VDGVLLMPGDRVAVPEPPVHVSNVDAKAGVAPTPTTTAPLTAANATARLRRFNLTIAVVIPHLFGNEEVGPSFHGLAVLREPDIVGDALSSVPQYVYPRFLDRFKRRCDCTYRCFITLI
jgi:hypothetical protein